MGKLSPKDTLECLVTYHNGSRAKIRYTTFSGYQPTFIEVSLLHIMLQNIFKYQHYYIQLLSNVEQRARYKTQLQTCNVVFY